MSKTINKIDRIDEIAKHYGFKKINIPSTHVNENSFLHPLQKQSILEEYKHYYPKQGKHISMFYHNKPILINKKTKNPISFKNFNFDILGVHDSIAEAQIIHTAITSLKEEGYKNPYVSINSLGDKDSLLNFKNNLFDFYKSRSDELHPKCKNFYKKDIIDLFLCNHRECIELRKTAPRPMYFLSDDSQRHLKKILEYLESMNIMYNIDDLLIGSDNHFSKIIFEIKHKIGRTLNEEILLGRGGRYDELAENTIRRKGVPAVGISLEFPQKRKEIILKKQTKNQPEFYFIQFGQEAKLKSLPIIEMLRTAKIKIKQDLHINKFGEQIDNAKRLGVQYTLILGHQEVIDNTIIVKDLKQVTQKVIKINKILDYLERLK
ncbi:hypothetical protein KKH36_03585 [Patescibacteria group bacterium]|nr:hypothetical protein [Patescibacteria group bacterium]